MAKEIEYFDAPNLTVYAKPLPLVESPWGDDAVAMSESGTVAGYYTADIGTPASKYVIVQQAGGSPAVGDTPLQQVAVEVAVTTTTDPLQAMFVGAVNDPLIGDPLTDTSYTVANIDRFRVGSILRKDGSAELLQVTAIAASNITVTRGAFGTTAEAITDQDTLLIYPLTSDQVSQALATYDGPTRAEATADKDELLALANAIKAVTDELTIASGRVSADVTAMGGSTSLDGKTPAEILIGIASALLGLSTNDGNTFRDLLNTKNRIESTIDANGNRTNVVLDLSV